MENLSIQQKCAKTLELCNNKHSEIVLLLKAISNQVDTFYSDDKLYQIPETEKHKLQIFNKNLLNDAIQKVDQLKLVVNNIKIAVPLQPNLKQGLDLLYIHYCYQSYIEVLENEIQNLSNKNNFIEAIDNNKSKQSTIGKESIMMSKSFVQQSQNEMHFHINEITKEINSIKSQYYPTSKSTITDIKNFETIVEYQPTKDEEMYISPMLHSVWNDIVKRQSNLKTIQQKVNQTEDEIQELFKQVQAKNNNTNNENSENNNIENNNSKNNNENNSENYSENENNSEHENKIIDVINNEVINNDNIDEQVYNELYLKQENNQVPPSINPIPTSCLTADNKLINYSAIACQRLNLLMRHCRL